MISIAAQKIYDRTKRHMPSYMLIASNILPILQMMDGFNPAPMNNINGPFFAGTIMGMKVFVSPAMTAGEYCLGVNGGDMVTSVKQLAA